jgi:transposase
VSTIATHADAIARGELVILYVDECHLCHGDASGYVWGPSKQRMEVPIVNARERQTYFGAVEPLTGELCVMEALTGDATWTVRFLSFVREQYAGKRVLLCWDGASYHRGSDVRTYLETLNGQRERTDWLMTCIQFAPHAPEQNPIEDVWLKAKSFVRRNWQRMDGTFEAIKALFEEAIMTMTVDFPKLHTYLTGLQLN